MILPFSSSRSSTSLSSNCLYWASLTPRAMFSKSMNIASFRSPFMASILWWGPANGRNSLGVLEASHELRRSGRRAPRPPGPDADRQVARPHLRTHPALRPRALDVPVLRARRTRDDLDVGGIPAVAARDRALGHPLRDPLVEARQRMGRCVGPVDRR